MAFLNKALSMSAARTPVLHTVRHAVRHTVHRSHGVPAFGFTPELTPISLAMCLLAASGEICQVE